MFNYVQGPSICEPCKKEIEESFQRVKDYIVENPRASLKQISEDNGVTAKQIQQWIREERLMFSKDSPLKLMCEKCGEPILTGRFCAKCKGTMADTLNESFSRPKPSLQHSAGRGPSAGMHFLDT